MRNKGIGSDRHCGNCGWLGKDRRFCTNPKGVCCGTISQHHCNEWKSVEKVKT
jgi:hypothetical protein